MLPLEVPTREVLLLDNKRREDQGVNNEQEESRLELARAVRPRGRVE